jgi:hypothetical protein
MVQVGEPGLGDVAYAPGGRVGRKTAVRFQWRGFPAFTNGRGIRRVVPGSLRAGGPTAFYPRTRLARTMSGSRGSCRSCRSCSVRVSSVVRSVPPGRRRFSIRVRRMSRSPSTDDRRPVRSGDPVVSARTEPPSRPVASRQGNPEFCLRPAVPHRGRARGADRDVLVREGLVGLCARSATRWRGRSVTGPALCSWSPRHAPASRSSTSGLPPDDRTVGLKAARTSASATRARHPHAGSGRRLWSPRAPSRSTSAASWADSASRRTSAPTAASSRCHLPGITPTGETVSTGEPGGPRRTLSTGSPVSADVVHRRTALSALASRV